MKYIILFLVLFIPNVFAESNALSCSYNSNGKTINFGYYISSNNEPVISNFLIDGDNYAYFYNKIQIVNLECPIIAEVYFEGDYNIHYFISDSVESLNESLKSNNILYDDEGNFIGQIKKIGLSSKLNEIEYVNYNTSEIMSSSGVSDSTRKQMDTNIEAYASNVCTYKEKTAIAEYFNENNFYNITSFYGDNIFKYNDEYLKLSDNCAEVASDLYNSTVALIHMLSDYADAGGNVNTINYLSLYSSYYGAYGALTTPWFSLESNENVCDLINGDIRNILNSFFDIFRLVCIILCIFMVYLDGMKCLADKDDSATKKWISNSIKRIIILVLVLMLPLIVNLVLDLVNKYMAGTYVVVDGECVKAITGG